MAKCKALMGSAVKGLTEVGLVSRLGRLPDCVLYRAVSSRVITHFLHETR